MSESTAVHAIPATSPGAFGNLMAEHLQAHASRHQYSLRLPTPPRITVPPPSITADVPNLTIGPCTNDQADISFLSGINLGEIIQRHTVQEWSYSKRRQAQMVLPWLYLGPMTAARDTEFLKREGITMVLAICVTETALQGALNAASTVCSEVARIQSPQMFDLTQQLRKTTAMINTHIAQYGQHTLQKLHDRMMGKVLVFCESGNEKSAAVVAAYLMETLVDLDYIKAMQVIQAQRFSVNFDDTIKNVLRTYGEILAAQRSIAFSSQQMAPQQNGFASTSSTKASQVAPQTYSIRPTKLKRTRDDTYDNNVTMDDAADEADALRFAGREIAPFMD